VITGASSGIGKATAAEFSRRGAKVAMAGRSGEALESVRKNLHAPERAICVPTDVTDVDSVQRLAEATIREFGRIDIWVNNAVVAMYGDFETVSLPDFRQVFETAFFGYVNGAAVVLPIFRKQSAGLLINIASVLGTIGIPHMSSYVAAKHAVVGFSECLRQELAGTGIDVCTIFPASIDSAFYGHAANFTGHRIHPLPPVYRPERVARAIVDVAEKPRKRRFVPGSASAFQLIHALFPQMTERVSRRLIDRFQIGKERAEPTLGNLYEPRHDEPSRRRIPTVVFAGCLGATAAAIFFFAISQKGQQIRAA
jgi:short-subunit dehydrogenase